MQSETLKTFPITREVSSVKIEEMADHFVNLIKSGDGDRQIECEGFLVELGDPLVVMPVDSIVHSELQELFKCAKESYHEWIAKLPSSDDDFGCMEREFRETQANESSHGYSIALDVSREVPWPRSES